MEVTNNIEINTINELLNIINSYNPDAVEQVKKAYDYANKMHGNQIRQSGEPYITHPLRVAYILACMHADCETLCAGLLHDTLEDTTASEDEIKELFGNNVYILVDGVTKISKAKNLPKNEEEAFNTRKIIVSITEDVRIIIIKLADRLHNMRTLQFKKPEKQKLIAQETLDLFVPLAEKLGAHQLKCELEDLSFKYLDPLLYNLIKTKRKHIVDENSEWLNNMVENIKKNFKDKNVECSITSRVKSVYGIYKKCKSDDIDVISDKAFNISDLFSIKIIVKDFGTCYLSLGLVHLLYKYMKNKFKDYITLPKTNLYSSIHTTVYGPNHNKVQIQIRTPEMDQTAKEGLIAYWNSKKGDAKYIMQANIDKYISERISELNKIYKENIEFVNITKKELLSNNIYPQTRNGNPIELPKGATVLDFAYAINPNIGNYFGSATVNGIIVERNYVLHNNDKVLITPDFKGPGATEEWKKDITTSHAETEMNKFLYSHNKKNNANDNINNEGAKKEIPNKFIVEPAINKLDKYVVGKNDIYNKAKVKVKTL